MNHMRRRGNSDEVLLLTFTIGTLIIIACLIVAVAAA